MVPYSFLLPLVVRSIGLLLPQTFFQPDEFYQALEPAHHLVFGYGHLTWEWKDLPAITGAPDLGEFWQVVVVQGRLRSWIWPTVFAGIFEVLQFLKLDHTILLTLLPRCVGVLIAALTDYATYRLGRKLLGPGASAGALFLSLTSLFNAHVLPRSLSTSPETMLTTLALVYFPMAKPTTPRRIIVGSEEVSRKAALDNRLPKKGSISGAEVGQGELVVDTVENLDYALMDRMDDYPAEGDNFTMSVFLASLATCIRPTTLPFWGWLGAEHVMRTWRHEGFARAVGILDGLLIAFTTITLCSAIDYFIIGRMTLPAATFIYRNIFTDLSSFYGGTDIFYHLIQSLPILLLPVWFWWVQGYLACLLPSRLLPTSLTRLDRPQALSSLCRALTFGIAVLSLSPHSEWRFLHPFLPSLLMFALPPMFRAFTPGIMGCWYVSQAVRGYVRLPKSAFYLCLVAPIVPWLYLSTLHGRGQVEVMNALRRGELGEVTSLAVLMPCHSTPWQSHLHTDTHAWFLTCEPPLDGVQRQTEQDIFYDAPVAYVESTLSAKEDPISGEPIMSSPPSHLVVFGDLLDRTDSSAGRNVGETLLEKGYTETWSMWNGFDLLQDEPKRRGGVRVFQLISP